MFAVMGQNLLAICNLVELAQNHGSDKTISYFDFLKAKDLETYKSVQAEIASVYSSMNVKYDELFA
jgi:hypothetical protein